MATRTLRIAGILLAATAGVAVASACSSFDDTLRAPNDAAPEATADAPSSSSAEAGDGGGAAEAGDGGCALTSTPSVVATVSAVPSKLQTNGQDVFWIEGGMSVERASLVDCTTTQIATGNINALAVDAQWIVWGDPIYHVVGRNDLSHPLPTAVPAVSPSLLLAGGTALWADPSNISACETPCIATTNATDQVTTTLLAANAFRFFFFAPDPDAGTTGNLWWQALKLTANNTIVGPIATGQDPIMLAAEGTKVFWVNKDGQLNGMPSGGGTPIALPKVPDIRALALDPPFVYVATPTSIGRVPVTGGVLSTVLTGEVDIQTMLVTTDAIVWGTSSAIRRVHK